MRAIADFKIVPWLELWRSAIGTEAPASADGSTDALLMTPRSHGTDGFFVAVLNDSKLESLQELISLGFDRIAGHRGGFVQPEHFVVLAGLKIDLVKLPATAEAHADIATLADVHEDGTVAAGNRLDIDAAAVAIHATADAFGGGAIAAGE